jgi:CheY-like chemotaxis protein
MASKNIFSALFLAKEGFAFESTRKIFEEFGIELRQAHSAAELDEWVRRRRVDLVVCDYDVPGVEQLECLQANTRWRGIAMLIVRGGQVREIRGKRVHFTVAKPFTADVLARSVRAAYTTMAKQRFTAYRHPLVLKPLAGTLHYRGWHRALAHTSIANLSQTGLCLAGPEPLPQGAVINLNFILPESDDLVHVMGTVIWSDASGKSGVRFNRLPAQEERRLQERLKARFPWNVELLFPPG